MSKSKIQGRGNFGLKVAIFADGARQEDILKRYREGQVSGFTTNPSLMAKSGIRDYEKFARAVVSEVQDVPISFEVFSDDFDEMKAQARKISSWASNINVKIPITNTKGKPAIPLIADLLAEGMKLNVTAIFTLDQMNGLAEILKPKDDVIVSVFAGRIADTSVDPVPLMTSAVEIFKDFPEAKVLWASPREVLNAYQAEQAGCHVITMTDDLIQKLSLRSKSLEQYSLETVQMFYKDAQTAGFTL